MEAFNVKASAFLLSVVGFVEGSSNRSYWISTSVNKRKGKVGNRASKETIRFKSVVEVAIFDNSNSSFSRVGERPGKVSISHDGSGCYSG